MLCFCFLFFEDFDLFALVDYPAAVKTCFFKLSEEFSELLDLFDKRYVLFLTVSVGYTDRIDHIIRRVDHGELFL